MRAAALARPGVVVRVGRHRPAAVAGILLVTMAALCFAAPVVEKLLGVDSGAVDLFNRFQPASAEHPLGTDDIGRDVLVRLLEGGQVSLLVGLSAAILASLIGTAIGLTAGYVGGAFDAALMRITDGVIALPLLPLLIVLAALDLEKIGVPAELAASEDAGLYRIVFIVALAGWTTVARVVRGATLSLRQRTFVLAAVSLGASPLRVMIAHLLPNLASPIIVATTLSVGNIILLESVLSFLGLGVQPPVPSWGNLLTNAQELIWQAPMLAVYPGVAIFVTVISFNLLGDALQDALDPRENSDQR